MAVRTSIKAVVAAIATIAEDHWTPIVYTVDGEAEVGECDYHGRRLIVRRTRLIGKAQAALWPDWRHFAFLTDLTGPAVPLDEFHRQHAVVELTIDDLKEGSGIDHIPSGNFSANGAWLCAAVLAHHLIRWTATIGAPHRVDQLAVARTIRTRLIARCPTASSTSTASRLLAGLGAGLRRPEVLWTAPTGHSVRRGWGFGV